MMDFEKFSERAHGFLQSGQAVAIEEGRQRLALRPIVKVLLDDDDGLADGLLRRAGGNLEPVRHGSVRA